MLIEPHALLTARRGRRPLPLTGPVPAIWLSAGWAEGMALASGDVSQWGDRSGNGNHAAQATAGNRPTYDATALGGRPGVDFTGATDALTAAAAASINNLWDGGGYYIGVIRKDSAGGGGFGCLMSKEDISGGTGWYMLCSLSRLYMHIKFSTMHGQWSVGSSPASPFIFEVEYNSDSTANDAVIRVNGEALAITEDSTPAGTRISDASDALTIGNRPPLDANWDGPHGEHLLYQSIPSTAFKAALRADLAAQYGVTLA